MNLIVKVLSAKATWVLIPIVGFMVAAQDCTQGLASAGLALGICGVIPFCFG